MGDEDKDTKADGREKNRKGEAGIRTKLLVWELPGK